MRTLLALVAFMALAVFVLGNARAHDVYTNWQSNGGVPCCNDHDCSTLPDEKVRSDRGSFEVRVEVGDETEWCPVEPRHYLRTGNAPDGSSYHACIQRSFENGKRWRNPQGICAHLLCFQPTALY